jgi:uncharacterized membrane protein YgcG
LANEISPLNNLSEAIQSLVQEAVQKAIGAQKTPPVTDQSQSQQAATTATQPSTTNIQTPPVTEQPKSTATTTDVSQVTTPVAEVSNMKTGEFVAPYQKQQQELAGQLQGAQLYDYSDASKNYIDTMFKQATTKFDYDINSDPLVAKAKEQVESSIINMANKRGFAYGSFESDIVKQQMDKLSGEFEEIAYNKNADYMNRQLSLANTMMKWEKIQFDRSKNAIELLRTKLDFFNRLEERDFNVFKIMLDNRNTQRSLALQQQKLALQRKRQEAENAYNRIESLGYVDNKASITLGIPVGTKAVWAQKASLAHQNKLEEMAKQNEYDLIKQKLDADMEKELYALKNRLDEASKMKYMALEYDYKTKIRNMEFEYEKKKAQILKEKEEARAAAAAAAAAARSRSSGGGGGSRSSGGGSSSQKVSNAKLNSRYMTEAKRFIKKFGNKKKYGQDAARYLDDLRRAGVEEAVLMRIKDEFNVPKLKSTAKKKAYNQKAFDAAYKQVLGGY